MAKCVDKLVVWLPFVMEIVGVSNSGYLDYRDTFATLYDP